jgi:hypothetical protein
VDFEKAFNTVEREAVWFKMRRIGLSENMVNRTKIMYEGSKFGVKCEENKVASFAPQSRG